MKRIALTIFLTLGIWSTCFAEDIRLAWDTPPSLWVTNIYLTETPGEYRDFLSPVASALPGENTATVKNLLPGKTYYFVATHFDGAVNIESDRSNEVSYTVPMPPEKVVTELEVPAVRKYKITLEVVE